MINLRIWSGMVAAWAVVLAGGAMAAPAVTRPSTAPVDAPQRREGRAGKGEEKPGVPAGDDKLSVTQGEVKIGGAVVKYTATAGTMVMKDEGGHPRANFFFVAYKRDVEHYDA